MKRRLACIAILMTSCLLLGACSLDIVRGSGKRITEARPVSGIDRVSLGGSGDVILTQGERESLTVETDDNVMQHVRTEVNGGTLTLGIESGVSVSPTRLRFTLTVVDLDGITVSGSGNVDAERFDTDRLEVKVTGSGNVELAGQVTGQEVTISGSGFYRGGDLRSETASVTISGSGKAIVWATESLDARVTGSGAVNYYGDPKVDVSGSGSGRVKRLGGR